jgi:hypothetical protein
VHVAALLAGGAVGLLGSFVHGYTTHGVPLGIIVALALSGAVFATSGLAARARSAALFAAGGWLLVVATLSLQRPEGDLVVPASTLGYCWLLGGALVAGVCLAWPYGGAAYPRRGDRLPGTPYRAASGSAEDGR